MAPPAGEVSRSYEKVELPVVRLNGHPLPVGVGLGRHDIYPRYGGQSNVFYDAVDFRVPSEFAADQCRKGRTITCTSRPLSTKTVIRVI
jgi:hypothetical protein